MGQYVRVHIWAVGMALGIPMEYSDYSTLLVGSSIMVAEDALAYRQRSWK